MNEKLFKSDSNIGVVILCLLNEFIISQTTILKFQILLFEMNSWSI